MLYRIQLTSTLKLCWWTQPMLLSVMTQGSTGSAMLSTNTGNFVVLPLLERNTGVFVEKGSWTTKQDLQEGLPGRRTRHFPFGATVENDIFEYVYDFLLSGFPYCRILYHLGQKFQVTFAKHVYLFGTHAIKFYMLLQPWILLYYDYFINGFAGNLRIYLGKLCCHILISIFFFFFMPRCPPYSD